LLKGALISAAVIAGVLQIALVIVVAVTTIQLTRAGAHMARGTVTLRRAVLLVGDGSSLSQAPVRSQVMADLRSAHGDFHDADSDIGWLRPELSAISGIPVVGPLVAAPPSLAAAGSSGSAAALELLEGTNRLWPVINAHASGPLLPRLAAPLGWGQTDFRRAEGDAEHAASALNGLPLELYGSQYGQLGDEMNRIRKAVHGMVVAGKWLSVSPGLIGWKTPEHILVAFEDGRELRATGGFIGAADFITIRHGVLTSHSSGSELPHEKLVPEPYPEADLTAEEGLLFRDANFSPSFPLSARIERWLYGEDTGRWADVVVNALDGAKPLLSVIGPVYLPDLKVTVTAGNVDQEAIHYIYDTYHKYGSGSQFDAERVKFVGSLMEALIARLPSLTVSQYLALGSALENAFSGQQFMIYGRSAGVESAALASGAAGDIERPAGDFLSVVDDNRSYSKLNPYVQESAHYTVHLSTAGWARAQLTLRYHINPSPNSIEGLGPELGAGGSKHDYLDFVRVLVPPSARLVSEKSQRSCPLSLTDPISCWQNMAPAPAYGLTEFAGALLVRQNQIATVTFRYDIPMAQVLTTVDTYGLTVARQASANLTAIGVTVDGPVATQVTTVALASRLNRITIGLGRSMSVQPATLSPTTEHDPYLPPSIFDDTRHPL
jgi:hypothetical protein